jgi:RIO kinase 1
VEGLADNRAYPRLKDAVIEDELYPVLYNQVLRDMRTMYQTCRLVHADLSEFNLLYRLSKRTKLMVGTMIKRCT